MWRPNTALLPAVLIVESGSGEIFIVENKDSKPQVDLILQKPRNVASTSKASLRRAEVKVEPREPSPVHVKQEAQEVKEEEEVKQEYQDDSSDYVDYETLEDTFEESEVPFEQTRIKYDGIKPEVKDEVKLDSSSRTTTKSQEKTFDGNWSDDEVNWSDDFPETDDDVPLSAVRKELVRKKKSHKRKDPSEHKVRKGFWIHKTNRLVGKLICKYCETPFASKLDRSMHKCEYLQCNPKNFICRICMKELSRGTFSNHLHETLDCPYCGRAFVNPRNMKAHIKNQHPDQEFAPPPIMQTRMEQSTIPSVASNYQYKPQIRRKPERCECDMCGKYLASKRSIAYHMSLHTGKTVFICEICGEKFFTPNGIKNHSCEKKRRRPTTDFRTYNLRYCRFCDSDFANYDENKAHACSNIVPEDPKSVICRVCNKILTKIAFNRHMEIHTGIDWVCTVCDKKLATERALKVHSSVHSGEKPYKCKLCAGSYINKTVLERHMRFHGAPIKLFRCEFCGKELSQEFSLKQHIRRVHQVTAQCELCKIEVATKEALKEHYLTEHGPSVCNICNKSFALPRYLKMHERVHYIDDTPRIQCPICSKNFHVKRIKTHVFKSHNDQFEDWQKMNPTLS